MSESVGRSVGQAGRQAGRQAADIQLILQYPRRLHPDETQVVRYGM